MLVSIAGAVAVVAITALVVSQAGGRAENGGDPSTTTPDTSPLVIGGAPARPEQVRIEPAEDSGQMVTWTAPSAADEDQYQVYFTDGPDDLVETSSMVEDTELAVDTDERICVIVETIRSGRVSAASTEVCSA